MSSNGCRASADLLGQFAGRLDFLGEAQDDIPFNMVIEYRGRIPFGSQEVRQSDWFF